MTVSEQKPTADHPPKRRLPPAAIAGLILLALLLLSAFLLLFDPFDWNLLDKVSGLRDEAAAAMPPDTAFYAEIDLVNFSEETLTDFSQPFVAALAEPGVEDLAGGLDRLDRALAAELGLTLREDVQPWLGRSVGLGLIDLTLAPDGQMQDLGWLLVAGTQDRQAADDFLEKLARLGDGSPVESRYRGRTITSFASEDQYALFAPAFTRSAGQVIIGSDEAAVRAAIDAQKDGSLAGEVTYQALVSSLPKERGLTLYADQARLPELSRLLGAAAPLAVGPFDLTSLTLPPGAAGVSIVDQGLRLDLASPAALSDESAQPPPPGSMAGLFPVATLAYLTGDSLDAAWTSVKGLLDAGGSLADFQESMALFAREFGFDPDQDLLPVLNGEWTLALLPAGEGLLADLTGLPLGLVLLAGGDDTQALSGAVERLNEGLVGQRLPLATAEVAGTTANYVDLESLLGAPLPLYGLDGDHLFLGTDAQAIADVLLAGTALSEDNAYARALALLPEDYSAGFYADLSRLRPLLIGDSDDRTLRLLEPVEAFIAASGPPGDDVRRSQVIIVIE